MANSAADSLGRDDNRAVLVHARGGDALDVMGKEALADRILDRVGGAGPHAEE